MKITNVQKKHGRLDEKKNRRGEKKSSSKRNVVAGALRHYLHENYALAEDLKFPWENLLILKTKVVKLAQKSFPD